MKDTLLAMAKGFLIGSGVMCWGMMLSGAKWYYPEKPPIVSEYRPDPVLEAYERSAFQHASMTVEVATWQPNTVTIAAGENTRWILLASGSAIILEQVDKDL